MWLRAVCCSGTFHHPRTAWPGTQSLVLPGARRSQEGPGEPGEARSSQEEPGGARVGQEELGGRFKIPQSAFGASGSFTGL